MAFFGFIGFLFPLVLIVGIVAVIAVAAGGRREPDPTGRRAYAVYLTAVTFITLFTLIGTTFALVNSLAELAFVDGADTFCPPGAVECISPVGASPGEGAGRVALNSALIAAVAAIVMVLHGRRVLDLHSQEARSPSPAGRTLLVFGYAVCFVLMFIALGAGAAALTSLVNVIDPASSFGDASGRGLATMVTGILFATGSIVLFAYVWRGLGLGIRAAVTSPPAAPPPPGE